MNTSMTSQGGEKANYKTIYSSNSTVVTSGKGNGKGKGGNVICFFGLFKFLHNHF